MRLLERGPALEQLDSHLDAARRGDGRVVLVVGEAGIGKTSLVREFALQRGDMSHVLWGACDDLLTARPLGPMWDMAFDEPALEQALESGNRQEVFSAVYGLIKRSLRPTMLVIEDVHWADDATLDLVKFVTRRVDRSYGLVVLTVREEDVSGKHLLRRALADIPHRNFERVELEPLSKESVATMAESEHLAEEIFLLSGGNPFLVTELLGSEEGVVPASITDAVSGRVMRLNPPARALVELASVSPGRLELALARDVLGDVTVALSESEKAGILALRDDSVMFRHELARRAVEVDLSEVQRRGLNLELLTVCEANGVDIARCAHHARSAGEPDEIVRILPDAARQASEAESHREAAAHLRALEPYLNRLTDGELADHYDLWAWEEFLLESGDAARIAARAVELRVRLGEPSALGRSLLAASRIEWVDSRRKKAVRYAEEAARVLEPVGGQELAMAYSTLSQLAMLASDVGRTVTFAEKALDLAGDSPSQVRAHAINNLGAVWMTSDSYPNGVAELEESFRLSEQLDLPHDSVRAAVNLAWGYLGVYELDQAEAWIREALRISEEAEMSYFESYAAVERAMLEEMRGNWDLAESGARFVIEHGLKVSRLAARLVEARVKVQTGAPDAAEKALEAWRLALATSEPIRTGPAATVLAQHLCLGGELDPSIITELNAVLDEIMDLRVGWFAGELAMWLWLARVRGHIPDRAPEPVSWLANGGWEKAAEFWASKGVPYLRAVVLAQGEVNAKLEALGILDGLGARPMAARVRSELRDLGIKGVPRGPMRKRRASPLGLTPRQTDVLQLLAEGLTNAQIADRIFVSTRTVDHHVSAILTQLKAQSRVEAVDIAQDAGLIE